MSGSWSLTGGRSRQKGASYSHRLPLRASACGRGRSAWSGTGRGSGTCPAGRSSS